MKNQISILLCLSLIWLSYTAQATIKVNGSTNTSAIGMCDGSIDIEATGSAGPFTFEWSTGQTTEDLTNVCAGQYSVSVTNAWGCTRVLDTIYIGDPMTYGYNNVWYANNGCGLGCIGLHVNGGIAPFNIAWTDGTNTWNSGGLVECGLVDGNYSATITDASGQTLSVGPFLINGASQPIVINGTVYDDCSNATNSGMIVLDVVGGSGAQGNSAYSFNWSNGQTTQNATNLLGGTSPITYTVTVTDANQCQAIQSFQVGESAGFDLGANVEEACEATEDGMISLNPNGGFEPYTYQWHSTAFPSTNHTSNDWYDLPPNTTYDVTVTDARGCQVTRNFFISKAAENTIQNASVYEQMCQLETYCKGEVVDVDYQGEDNFNSIWRWWEPWNPLPYTCEVDVFCPIIDDRYTIQGMLTVAYSGYQLYSPAYSVEEFICDKLVDCQVNTPNNVYTDDWTHDHPMTEVQISEYCYEVSCNGNYLGTYCKTFDAARTKPKGDIIIFPNPFEANIRVLLVNNTSPKVNIQLIDVTGKLIYEKILNVQEGEDLFDVQLNKNPPKGVYILNVKYSDGTFTTRKLVKQ